MNNQREKFGSRLGFLLISAGCAIGLGNVYRFPIITGAYGGAFFVLIYLAFLLLLGIPVMCAELAVGRASQRSIATSFEVLEKKGQKWHLMKYLGVGGNYLLMMCYTVVAGYMLTYFCKYIKGDILQIQDSELLKNLFHETSSDPLITIISTFVVIIVCFAICSLGLKNGVEKITKVMMIALFSLIILLAVYCCTLSGAGEGIKFYLVPSVENIQKAGIWTTVYAAMGQAFFTLSVGMGSISVFGSYIGKDRSLLGESVTIVSLDTFIALMSGLIVFPACFTYNNGITADSGSVDSSFLFTTLSKIFNSMPAGRIIGALFFLFILFAALSTVIAVFENIMSFWLELTNLNRKTIALINIVLLLVLSLPAALSNGVLSDIKIFGMNFAALEDTAVSNLILPLGSLIYVVFCTSRYGWGWKNFFAEVNAGNGLKFPKWMKHYMTYVLPVLIAVILVISLF